MIHNWRQTLDDLRVQTGISFEEVCGYAGVAYNEQGVSFYQKLPKARRTFIGIGMAYGQPLAVINEWIMVYGGKRELYAKDISEDLIWIYLIGANEAAWEEESGPPEKNYYRLYDECQAVAFATWEEMWDEITTGSIDTADVEIQLENVDYDENFDGLKDFITDHMDSFKTAYSKPRKYLARHVDMILDTCMAHSEENEIRGLTDLRGWLDDSMINFLSGDPETINVIDPKTRKRTVRIKHVPKNKKTYIMLCLALGMGADEINEYLGLMGFLPLGENNDEQTLIKALAEWEKNTPEVRKYKERHRVRSDKDGISIKTAGRAHAADMKAVEEMMLLRQTLRTRYQMRGLEFPYLKWL